MTKITFAEKQKTLFQRKKALTQNATPSELFIKALFDSMGIRYMFQKAFIQGNFYCIVDFYIPKKRICIEVDGGYHDTENQSMRDSFKDRYLTVERGFKVIRMTNEQALKMNQQSLWNCMNQ